MLEYDVVIIGSGIAGMTCALYLKRGGVNPLVIEKDTPGGQLNKIATIENYPGFIEIDGPTLGNEVYKQVNNLDVDYLYEEVIEADLNKETKILKTPTKEIKCRFVVIATGRTARMLTKDDRKLIGKGISYCGLCDGTLYKDEEVVVVGGGASAIKEALYLSKICRKVRMVIRKDYFRAEKGDINKVLKRENIEVLFNSNIVKYNLVNDKIDSVLLDTGKEIKAKCVFITIGSIPNSDIYSLDKENNFIITDTDYMTSIPNVYACGDIIKKHSYQLTTATGEATTVAEIILSKIN